VVVLAAICGSAHVDTQSRSIAPLDQVAVPEAWAYQPVPPVIARVGIAFRSASVVGEQSLHRDLASTTQGEGDRALEGEPAGAGSGLVTVRIVAAYSVAAVEHPLSGFEVITDAWPWTPHVFVMLGPGPQGHLEPIGVQIVCGRWCNRPGGSCARHSYHREGLGYSSSHDQSLLLPPASVAGVVLIRHTPRPPSLSMAVGSLSQGRVAP
jgi:hypothetical protein